MQSYLKSRVDDGDSFETIAASFHIELPWLHRWLEENNFLSDDSPHCAPIQDNTSYLLSKLSFELFKTMLEEWVTSRRELCDGESLCCAVMKGDVVEVKRLLMEEDVAWDVEDRFGITAGEYALYFKQAECLELLLEIGANETVVKMKAAASISSTPSSALVSQLSSTSSPTKKQKVEVMEEKQKHINNVMKPAEDVDVCIQGGDDEVSSLPQFSEPRSSWGYLEDKARYSRGGSLVDNQGMPVMMPWEAQLMEAHAREMNGASHPLNIGFGCGYVDSYIQQHVSPLSHTIIEAHPDVISMIKQPGGALMLKYKWLSNPSVKVKEGKWQDVMPLLVEHQRSNKVGRDDIQSQQKVAKQQSSLHDDNKSEIGGVSGAGSEFQPIDAIFYDTHDEGVPAFLSIAKTSATLLRTGERSVCPIQAQPRKPRLFSFWNGMEFHNAFRHGVYCRALQAFLLLPEGGSYSLVTFQRINLSLTDADWLEWECKGIRYWHLKAYYLPMCYIDKPPSSINENVGKVSVCFEDLSDWMVEGIKKGAQYHGFTDS